MNKKRAIKKGFDGKALKEKREDGEGSTTYLQVQDLETCEERLIE
jgi:hypothetical protein